jgi:hypothetical protein
MKSYSILQYSQPIEGKIYYQGDSPNAIYSSVELKDNSIVFSIDTQEDITLPIKREVPFDELKLYSDDHGLISVYTELSNPNDFRLENTIQRTYIGRQQIRDFVGKRLAAQIITPYKNSDPSEWDMIILDDSFGNIQGFSELQAYNLLTDWHKAKFKDNLDLESGTTVTAGDKLEIMVNNMIPAPVFLETTAGNLSHYRVQDSRIINLDTTGLTPGEVVKVKAGRRYFPGIQEVLVSVQ